MNLGVSKSEITLGEQVTLQSGYAFSSELFSENGVKLITPKNFTKTGRASFTVSNTKYTTEGVDAKYICEKGDLLMLLTDLTPDCRLLGKPALLESAEEVLLNQRIIKVNINDNSDLDKGYLLQYLLTDKWNRRMRVTATGTTVRHSSNKIVLSTKLVVPPIPEQQKIASFLSRVDEKIALLTEKKDKLAEYKKGVMQQLFNGRWEEQDGQLTFVPPTLRFKADDGSEFPDWEEKKLGSLADLTSSKRVYLSDYSEDGVPFFRGKEISEIRKGIIPDDVLYITRKAFEEFKSKYGAPVEGDILVTAVGTLANILRVTGEFEFYFKDGNLIWLRKPRCDSKFLSILMEANKHELLKTAIGSSQKALTIVELKKIVFKMPSLEEQQKITMFLSSLEEKVRLANSELEKAKEWKKGLLQQMFV
ncbi:restriction endonuclease subunit S [Vibrio nereis]|uniref:restriction endonuclease subunit S n=1 Tax=Vibrio nereis TaxID=693 RepID=UPI0024954BC5|nr:restriction endonuclease subunit S [Vibrio nereis]